ncbi:adenosylcobinamide-GDP ribazoletransferase [Sphingobium sufflavum]|uniref:adenosylcobinamide-GDP ribazoletransferase n=1 Tax=Sphingobium sufflavum TaxID=1129547 RepID=UPI001F420C4F|nr:adenosylcobinamide-GDP ribazoletransferase [Sphingobium sufflavum]MCE7795473.1 adenosylcobinamide-GDP ribazoletransferase [Sphingobium sufflavum]
MKGLLIALQFLTRLPTPRFPVSDAQFATSIRWFPAVGLVVGGIVAGALWLGALVDPWVAALAALGAWVWVTGALHLDGLGDVMDAAGAVHKGRERLLAVLADPHIGSFGVVAITLQLIAKLVLLHGLAERHVYIPLVLIPFAARIGPLVWTRGLPSLHDGLGARFRDAVGKGTLLLWALALLAAAGFVPAILAVVPLVVLWNVWLSRTLGGISGDGHGAGIELIETGLLLAALIMAGWDTGGMA